MGSVPHMEGPFQEGLQPLSPSPLHCPDPDPAPSTWRTPSAQLSPPKGSVSGHKGCLPPKPKQDPAVPPAPVLAPSLLISRASQRHGAGDRGAWPRQPSPETSTVVSVPAQGRAAAPELARWLSETPGGQRGTAPWASALRNQPGQSATDLMVSGLCPLKPLHLSLI